LLRIKVVAREGRSIPPSSRTATSLTDYSVMAGLDPAI
jgi:hypothetical protein